MSDTSSAAAAAGPAERQRTGTMRRSCEACRAVKARCIVVEGAEAAGQARRCKRCRNAGLECVFENTFARPKKLSYAARTRVRDVEEKLNHLIGLIEAGKVEATTDAATASAGSAASGGTTDATASISSASPPSDSESPKDIPITALTAAPTAIARLQHFLNKEGLGKVQMMGPTVTNVKINFDESPRLSQPLAVYYGDAIDRRLLNEEMASAMLADFASHCTQQFPFVLLPSYASLGYMRRQRPFLLMAILVVAASADRTLQARLALDYRKTLAQAVVVEGRSNLDVLQSVLVFCMWYHHYLKAFTSQLFQLAQMAVTMAVEMNLPNLEGPTLAALLKATRRTTMGTSTEQLASAVERARTFLGTYYLATSMAFAHRQPSPMRYSARMDQACELLVSVNEEPSDVHAVPYYVQIQKLTEDVDRVLGRVDQGGICADVTYIDTMVHDFERQYEQLRQSMTPEAWNNSTLQCALGYLPATIYQVALRVPPEHQALLEATPDAFCCNWCTSPTRLSILFKCIAACQSYITSFLDLPPAAALRSTIFEATCHIEAVLSLIRISLGFATANLRIKQQPDDITAVGDNTAANGIRVDLMTATNPRRYLDASERKMAKLAKMMNNLAAKGISSSSTTAHQVEDASRNAFWQLRHVFLISLAWFCKHVRELPPETDSGIEGGSRRLIYPLDAHEDRKLNTSALFFVNIGAVMTQSSFHLHLAKVLDNACGTYDDGGTIHDAAAAVIQHGACEGDPDLLTGATAVEYLATMPASVMYASLMSARSPNPRSAAPKPTPAAPPPPPSSHPFHNVFGNIFTFSDTTSANVDADARPSTNSSTAPPPHTTVPAFMCMDLDECDLEILAEASAEAAAASAESLSTMPVALDMSAPNASVLPMSAPPLYASDVSMNTTLDPRVDLAINTENSNLMAAPPGIEDPPPWIGMENPLTAELLSDLPQDATAPWFTL